jgi:transcriptional regulator with XRE-family HTH domain
MPMTAGQFRECLQKLRWSQVSIAEDLGVTPLRVRQWSAGLAPIPDEVANWIRPLAADIKAAYDRNPLPRYVRRQSEMGLPRKPRSPRKPVAPQAAEAAARTRPSPRSGS